MGGTLRLVTTNNVEVFRHLGSASFQRLRIEHTVASSYEEALQAIRVVRPSLAVIDTELAGGSGYELCRVVKDDPELRVTHVILLLPSVITRRELERIHTSGCDDILALPLHSEDFYHHLALLGGLPVRRNRRVGIDLDVTLPNVDHLAAQVVNVSSGGGLGIALPEPLTQGQEVVVRLCHDEQTYPDATATVAWVSDDFDRPGEYQAGLELAADAPIKVRILLEQLALFDVSQAPFDSAMAGGVTVALQGDFTEITDFTPLAQRLEHERFIDFDASGVRYVSSAGVRAWCQFLETLSNKHYTFRHCSLAFTSQAAMVPMVIGCGQVLSLEAPYACDSCEREELRLLEVKSLLMDGNGITRPPPFTCSRERCELVFDDVPERYFAFLRPVDPA